MADLFVLKTDDTGPFVTFMLLIRDQSAARTTTLTQLAFAVIISTALFLFMIIKASLTHKESVAEVAGYSNPCGYTRGTGHKSLHVCSQVCIASYLQTSFARLTYVTISRGPCPVSDDVIVLRDLVEQKINALFRLDLS